MKKRIFTLTLALIMCLTLAPAAAFAAGSGSLSLDKTAYMPGEDIIVTYSGITQQMVDAEAYISIYKAGANHSEYMNWDRPEIGAGQLTLEAPAVLGLYEMRLYNEDHKFTDDTFVMSVSFTVSMQKQGKISLEKNAYQAQQEIPVTVTEITKEMEQTGAFVAIYKKGAKHNEYGAYQYVKPGNSTVAVKSPNQNGEFEMRLYSIDHNYSDESFVMSVPLTLSGAVAQQQQQQQQVSSWAKTEIDKAAEYGLIPNSLKSADLTKSITREEFAELGVKLYEQTAKAAAAAASPNPFTDTSNPEILKAYKLGITSGTSATTFAPKTLINREQCAAMLFRTINAIHPGGDYSITGIPDFPDQKSISAYAVTPAKYMSKLGIVKGDAKGYFMPKATTTAQTASGYGMATREAAILMSVRTYDKVDEIRASKTSTAPAVPEATAPEASTAPTPPAAVTQPQTPAQTETSGNSDKNAGFSKDDFIGEWSKGGAYSADYISGNINVGTMSIINGAYYKFNVDGTFRCVISTLGGYIGNVRYDSQIVYETGTYKVDGSKVIFSDRIQTYYKGTPLVLMHKDKKLDQSDDLIIEEFDHAGKRFKIMLGWLEKQS